MIRRRLKRPQRREQLLDVGARLFAEKPYDDVMVHEIAAVAGVSRALMYEYFPTKRDLYVAILQRASDRFLARVNADQQLPLAEQLAAALDAHIQSLVENPFEAVAINRSTSSDDPAIQAIITEELNTVGRGLVDHLVAQGSPRGVGEIAVEGWLAFVRAACVKWIDSQNISRADLTEICLRAFDCALQNPSPADRWRARVSGVMQSPAISSLIRKSQSAALARFPGMATGHYEARVVAVPTARSGFAVREGS